MLVGQQIGPFAIEKQLGSGAMGTVYLATYTENGAKCAVKMIGAGAAGNPNTLARFERETAILKKLNHPNIVRLFANGRYHHTPFYAMEYVEGESLDRLLHSRGRFTWEEVINLGKQICAALQHAHELGIIHRDLKPSNILMTPGGVAKLADFGIAKGLDAGQLTATNCAVGTAAYMSPEQCRGEKNLTGKADLYSLGVMFYELLTGRLPFPADNTLDMFLAHTQGEFERPSRRVLDIPIWLDTLVCQLLEKDPDRRPVDAAMVARSLDMVSEKVAAQKSAGVELVSTRAARLRKTLKTNQQDLDAARTLQAAVKKTRIRRRSHPIYERSWVQGIAILLALAAVVGVLWYALQPPSADGLYVQAEKLMTSGSAEDGRTARDGPIQQYLKYYGSTQNEHTAQIHRWADQVDLQMREAQLRNRKKVGLTASTTDPNEKTAAGALDDEQKGNLASAFKRWNELLPLKDDADSDAHGWGLVAQKHLADLQEVQKLEKSLDQWIKQLDRRPKIAEPLSDPMTQALRAMRYQQFGKKGDTTEANQQWEKLKKAVAEEGPNRPWWLLAAREQYELSALLPAPADARDLRLAGIRQQLDEAKSPVSFEVNHSYAICRTIVDLYGERPDPEIKPLVDEARLLKAKWAKELKR